MAPQPAVFDTSKIDGQIKTLEGILSAQTSELSITKSDLSILEKKLVSKIDNEVGDILRA